MFSRRAKISEQHPRISKKENKSFAIKISIEKVFIFFYFSNVITDVEHSIVIIILSISHNNKNCVNRYCNLNLDDFYFSSLTINNMMRCTCVARCYTTVKIPARSREHKLTFYLMPSTLALISRNFRWVQRKTKRKKNTIVWKDINEKRLQLQIPSREL